jgi:hypothetical protein
MDSVIKAGYHLRFGSFVLLLSSFGILYAFYKDRSYWWVLTGAAWFFIQLTLIDYEGARDLYLGMAFSAIGIGLIYSKIPSIPKIQRHHIVMLVIAVIFSNILVGFYGIGLYSGMSVQDSIEYSNNGGNYEENLHNIYWNKHTPDSCYYTAPFSGDLNSWTSEYNEPYERSSCPSLPEVIRIST